MMFLEFRIQVPFDGSSGVPSGTICDGPHGTSCELNGNGDYDGIHPRGGHDNTYLVRYLLSIEEN